MLNKENLSVYVDWMIDKDGLPKAKMNKKTLATLELRMMHCDTLLYVHTENCKDSMYIKWELDLAKQYNVPMTVLNIGNIAESNVTEQIPHAFIKDGRLFIPKDRQELLYKQWLSRINQSDKVKQEPKTI